MPILLPWIQSLSEVKPKPLSKPLASSHLGFDVVLLTNIEGPANSCTSPSFSIYEQVGMMHCHVISSQTSWLSSYSNLISRPNRYCCLAGYDSKRWAASELPSRFWGQFLSTLNSYWSNHNNSKYLFLKPQFPPVCTLWQASWWSFPSLIISLGGKLDIIFIACFCRV